MDDRRTVLTERITCAEDWLARARRQVEGGEHTRGVLTLLLAEAEVHRARELGTRRTELTPPRGAPVVGPIVAAVAAAAIVAAVAVWHPFGAAGPAGDPLAGGYPAAGHPRSGSGGVSPHPIVALADGSGMLLHLVQAREDVERTVTVPVAVRVMVRVPASPATAGPAVLVAPGPHADVRLAVTQPAPRRPEAAPLAAASPAPTETSTLLSEAELIDLVLATERSLRRSTNQ